MQAVCVLSTHTLRTRVRWITVEDLCVLIARVCHGDVSSSLQPWPRGLRDLRSVPNALAAPLRVSTRRHGTLARGSQSIRFQFCQLTRGFGIFACSARRTARGLSVIVFAALAKALSTHPHRRPVLKFTIRRSPLENDGDGGFCQLQGDDVRGCALLRGPREMQSESRMRPRARASVLASARTPPRRLGRRSPLLRVKQAYPAKLAHAE